MSACGSSPTQPRRGAGRHARSPPQPGLEPGERGRSAGEAGPAEGSPHRAGGSRTCCPTAPSNACRPQPCPAAPPPPHIPPRACRTPSSRGSGAAGPAVGWEEGHDHGPMAPWPPKQPLPQPDPSSPPLGAQPPPWDKVHMKAGAARRGQRWLWGCNGWGGQQWLWGSRRSGHPAAGALPWVPSRHGQRPHPHPRGSYCR